MMFFRCKDTLFSHENFVENLREYFRDVSLFPHCFRNIIDFGIAKRRGRDEMDENWLAARAGLRMACGQKSEKIYLENLRKYFRIVSAVSALFSQYNRFLDCEKMRNGRNGRKLARCASFILISHRNHRKTRLRRTV